MPELIEEKKLKYLGIKGIPHEREPGSAVRHKTGDWRVFKPKIDYKKCISCKICFTFCPDSAIHWEKVGNKEIPVFDYHVCKGCLICKQECPVKAISADLDSHEDENEIKDTGEK